jgi:hypothetical protein
VDLIICIWLTGYTSSALSSFYADEARSAVLAFFRAPPEYTVVFTANASTALKLVSYAALTYVDSADIVLLIDRRVFLFHRSKLLRVGRRFSQ